ncbi:oligosaccharide flippase family protein [bacterium]|nr:oligosaccharide flippase family protein [bacterium]
MLIEKIELDNEIYTIRYQIKKIADGSWIILNLVIKCFFGFVGSIIFARLAGSEYFGQYYYIFSLSSMVLFVLLPGIENALINSTVKKTEGDFEIAFKKKIKLFPFFLLFSLLLSVMIWFIKKDLDIASAFLIVGILTGVINLFDYYKSYFIGKKEYKIYFIFESTVSFSIIIMATGYYLLSNYLYRQYVPLSILVLLPLIWKLLVYFTMFNYVRKRLTSVTQFSYDFFLYAKNLSFVSIIGSIHGNMDRFIIGTFLSYQSLAFYSIGKKFFDVLKNLCIISQQYLQPRLVKLPIKKALIFFKSYLNIYWLMVPTLICCWLVFPFIVEKFYGQNFLEAASYARLFLLVILFAIPNFYLETFFKAKQFYKELYISKIIYLLMLIPLIFFVFYFKAYGIIMNRALTMLIVTLVMGYLFFTKGRSNG